MSYKHVQWIAIFTGYFIASLFDFLISTMFNEDPGRHFIIGFLSASCSIGVLDWLTKRLGDRSSSVETNTEKKQ